MSERRDALVRISARTLVSEENLEAAGRFSILLGVVVSQMDELHWWNFIQMSRLGREAVRMQEHGLRLMAFNEVLHDRNTADAALAGNL